MRRVGKGNWRMHSGDGDGESDRRWGLCKLYERFGNLRRGKENCYFNRATNQLQMGEGKMDGGRHRCIGDIT